MSKLLAKQEEMGGLTLQKIASLVYFFNISSECFIQCFFATKRGKVHTPPCNKCSVLESCKMQKEQFA